MRYRFSLIILILYCSTTVLISQQNNFITYTAKNGLPLSTITAIAQDSRNYLWIGTDGGGVCRFDGLNFQTFTSKDGLSGNRIWSIMEDSSGILWFGTENGISIFD
ncbi:MAG: hypothetical protein KAT15_30595, partial [Bacteroidales bacterium]|nr:hypothetical protein [Bacteroidales bacterium]